MLHRHFFSPGRFALAVIATVPSIAGAANWFVSPSGNDGAAGTFSAPLATVQRAANLAQPGDTIHLRGGTYRETVEFGNGDGNSGLPGSPIVVTGYSDEKAVISAFDVIVPGQDGAGVWTQHDANIWKIAVPAGWTQSVGNNLIRVDGELQQEARWPNAPGPINFDYREMAWSEHGQDDLASEGPQLPYEGEFITGTYLDDDLPPSLSPNALAGALIDVNGGGGSKASTGIVVGNLGSEITFRYQRTPTGSNGMDSNQPYFLWNSLALLDSPGECFLDVQGVSGPADVLYLWSPEGDPTGRLIEMKTRSCALLIRVASHLRFERFTCLGGEIDCRPISSFVDLRELTILHAGRGLNRLGGGRASVFLDGANHSLRDSYVGATYGGGVKVGGANGVVENNVVRRCMEYGIGTWGSTDVVVNRNTVAESGGLNVAVYSPSSEFNHNRCYLAGLRRTDEASMNYNGIAGLDMLGTEVAYNWVHDNVARVDLEKEIRGGKGIRLDSASGSAYNMLIHHNVIWNIAGNSGLTLWGLFPGEDGYGDSKIRAYHNTLDGDIRIGPKVGTSVAGHDIRNNIARRIVLGSGDGKDQATVSDNLFTNQGFSARDWPGNLYDAPDFVDAPNKNFYLLPESPALDSGVLLPPVTDGFADEAPDLGAYEFRGPDARLRSAGAIILPQDIPDLAYRVDLTSEGRALHIFRIPEGRILPDGFVVKIGVTEYHHLSYSYSIETHRAEAIVDFLPADEPSVGRHPLFISTDSGATWMPAGEVSVPPLDGFIPSTRLPPSGGPVTLPVVGIFSKEKLIPIDVLRAQSNDLNLIPVPLVVNTRDLIAAGEMNPDASNVRFRDLGSTFELDYFIESGLNSESTLFWIRNKPGETTGGAQIYLALEDPSLPPVSDRNVLMGRYTPLEDPSLSIWYSANTLSADFVQDESVSVLPDLSARGNDAVTFSDSSRPHWNRNRLAGLPSVTFDGSDFLLAGTIAAAPVEDVSYIIVHRNELGATSSQRLISTGSGNIETFRSTAGNSQETFQQINFRPSPLAPLQNFTIGKKAAKPQFYYTGEIAEILLWDKKLPNSSPGPWELAKEYVSRKYGMAEEARGQMRPHDTIEPARLFLGGTEITDFTILPDGSFEFEVPPAPPGELLPLSSSIRIVSGDVTISALSGIVYFESNYDGWAAPLVPEGNDLPSLDLDGDLLTNLLEYLMDEDPEHANPMPFWAAEGVDAFGENVLHIYFRRSTTATDALVLFEYSTDGQDWTLLGPDQLDISVADPDPDGDGSAQLFRAEVRLDTARLKLFRIRAELLSEASP